MSRIFWDTNIFIYFFEDHGHQGKAARHLRERMLRRGDELVTSTMTLGEILVKPRERGDLKACKLYEEAIVSTSLVVPFDLGAARTFSALRATRSLRAPDAIQLACAASVETDVFLTNDSRLSSLQVDRVHFILPLSRSPL